MVRATHGGSHDNHMTLYICTCLSGTVGVSAGTWYYEVR